MEKKSEAKRLNATLPEFGGFPWPGKVKAVGAGFAFIYSVAAVSALCLYLRSLSRVPSDWVMPLAGASHLLALIILIAIMFLRSMSAMYKEGYVALERAIVTENLSVREIRTRFETELLGPAIADWLRDLGDRVQREHTNLQTTLRSVQDRAREIETIDPQYKLERVGRLSALKDEWSKGIDGHLARLDGYIFQLKECNNFPLSQDERMIVSRIREDWTQLLKEAQDESHSTAGVLSDLAKVTVKEDGPKQE